jgi:hypothetical protein
MAKPLASIKERAVPSLLFCLAFVVVTSAIAVRLWGLPLSPDAGYASFFGLVGSAIVLALGLLASLSFSAGLSAVTRVPSILGAACRGGFIAVVFCGLAYALFVHTPIAVALPVSVASLVVLPLVAAGALRGYVP